jgi:hypothetical protein
VSAPVLGSLLAITVNFCPPSAAPPEEDAALKAGVIELHAEVRSLKAFKKVG